MENSIDINTEIKVILFCLKNRALHVLVHPQTGSVLVSFPTRLVQVACSLEENAQDCLKNLLPHGEIYLEQLYTYGNDQNKQGKCKITIVYFALLPNNKSDLQNQEAIWLPMMERERFSEKEAEKLDYALHRLRYKLEYTAIGFELLPDTFSLSDLQQTYEIILDEELDKRNFRRRMLEANIIEPTPLRKTGEGRPATLYRYRSDAVAEIKARRLFP
jgi:8-oxo-dGTP diphosphatase